MRRKKIIELVVATALVLSLSTADTIAIQFIVKIDRIPPFYFDFGSNASVISKLNDSIKFYAYWEDNFWLGNWKFEWNISGNWINDTEQVFENAPKTGWSNLTKIINEPTYEGRTVAFRFHASDLFDYWNSTQEGSFSIISQSPKWSSLGPENGSPVSQGENITLYSFWDDNFNVETAVLELNATGSFTENGSILINSVSGWSNFTINTTGMLGNIYWKIRANDSIGNENVTEVRYFTVS